MNTEATTLAVTTFCFTAPLQISCPKWPPKYTFPSPGSQTAWKSPSPRMMRHGCCPVVRSNAPPALPEVATYALVPSVWTSQYCVQVEHSRGGDQPVRVSVVRSMEA